jgi:hypothetical protein
MSKKLDNCQNNFTVEELYDKFGIDDHEFKTCQSCSKFVYENGTMTCKYIVDSIDDEEEK